MTIFSRGDGILQPAELANYDLRTELYRILAVDLTEIPPLQHLTRSHPGLSPVRWNATPTDRDPGLHEEA